MPVVRCASPGCQKPFRVDGILAGKRLKCPYCGHIILVPEPVEVGSDSKNRSRPTPPSWIIATAAGAVAGALLVGVPTIWWTRGQLAQAGNELRLAQSGMVEARDWAASLRAESASLQDRVKSLQAEVSSKSTALVKAQSETQEQVAELQRIKAEADALKVAAAEARAAAETGNSTAAADGGDPLHSSSMSQPGAGNAAPQDDDLTFDATVSIAEASRDVNKFKGRRVGWIGEALEAEITAAAISNIYTTQDGYKFVVQKSAAAEIKETPAAKQASTERFNFRRRVIGTISGSYNSGAHKGIPILTNVVIDVPPARDRRAGL